MFTIYYIKNSTLILILAHIHYLKDSTDLHVNGVNPPFESIIHQGKKKGPTAWVRKAIEEHNKGKTVVLVYPIDKWILMLLNIINCEVRNLGDIKWLAIEDGSPGKGTGRHIACFILRAKP